jgi:pyruvate,water dikinase
MIIKGKVKIIKKPQDYYQIKNKVIIVAENTTPDIVIVINKVKAIITEIDNKLCHAAIIAREYKKPIVMGRAGVTKKYKDGDTISINIISKTIC